MHFRIRHFCVAAAAVASFAVPATASASEVVRDGDTLILRGVGTEKNHLQVRIDHFNSSRVTLVDATDYAMTADPSLGCELTSSGFGRYASCPRAGWSTVRLEGGAGADHLDVDPNDLSFPNPIELDGGPGEDDVQGPTLDIGVVVRGGEGDDKVTGGEGPDTVEGGPGQDKLEGGGGDDIVRGGDGDDDMSGGKIKTADVLDGGAGVDSVTSDWFSSADSRPPAISVTLDGVANDGRPDEGDNVMSVEHIETTRVATLVAGSEPVFFQVANTPAGNSRLVGSPGNDRLRAGDYDDVVDGGGGADAIASGGGNDTVTGGSGPDTIFSDGGTICDFINCSGSQMGNDTVYARDGEKDSIDCGPGTDTAVVDPIDVVASCEVVDPPRGGTPTPTPTPKPGTDTDPPTGGGGSQDRACVVPRVRKGATVASVRRALKAAGCGVATRKVRSSTVKSGRVVALSRRSGSRVRTLRAGTKLKAGTKVTIDLSRGRR